MSCYFRHLQAIFSEAGIEVTSYKDCPATWKKIKLGTADSESKKEFIQKLKIAVQKI
jgi:hypothetical protein